MNAMFQPNQSELSSIIRDMSGVAGMQEDLMASLQRKIDGHLFNIVVAGEFKRGKSTFINALLGDEVLPMGVVPLTSVITIVKSGPSAAIRVQFSNGDSQLAQLSRLPDYVTEQGNPGNCKEVRDVTVYHPSSWLKAGLQLVDTPGVGSVHQQNSEVTHHYLPQSDAVIFIISADQPLSHNELDFLVCIRRHAAKVFCVLNKVDLLSPSELQESIAFTSGTLRKAMGMEVPILPISARQALQVRKEGGLEPGGDSGLPNFEYALQHFLRDDRERIWIESTCRQIVQCLAQRELANDVEIRALELPLEQLELRLDAFSKKRAALLQAQEDMGCLILSDCQKTVKRRLQPDLDTFKRHLRSQLQDHLEQWGLPLRRGGTRALQAGLEERTVSAIRSAFDAWRKEEGVLLNAELEETHTRFWTQMCGLVDDLAKYSASIFEIPFAPVQLEALQKDTREFSYKFWSEPSGLSLLGNLLIRGLPMIFSYPILLRRARLRADELIETQAGRIRHDFEEHLRKDATLFQQEMSNRHEAVGLSIEQSIRSGMESKALTEAEVVIRRADLSSTRTKIGCIKERLVGHIKAAA